MTFSKYDYQVLSTVGEGGQAKVYRCVERRTGRELVLKIPKQPNNPAARRRFVQEADRLVRCAGRGVIDVVAFNRTRGVPLLFLEYAHRGSLREQLARGKFQHPLQALYLMRDVAAALARIHRKGIVHRDIKPSNILMGRDDNPKVADFGLATSITNWVRFGHRRVGTPYYMAPEQKHGTSGPFNDVYPLGLILYELVMRRRPESLYRAPVPSQRWPRLLDESFARLILTLSHEDYRKRPTNGWEAQRYIRLEIQTVQRRLWRIQSQSSADRSRSELFYA